jgi:hypothetical protein
MQIATRNALLIVAIMVVPVLVVMAISLWPRPAPHARLLSVKELTAQERLGAICDTVRDEAYEIVLRHPDGIGHPEAMRSMVSEAELGRLWLYDYACSPKNPTVAF